MTIVYVSKSKFKIVKKKPKTSKLSGSTKSGYFYTTGSTNKKLVKSKKGYQHRYL